MTSTLWGIGVIHGLDNLREISAAFVEDERKPVGHHGTNVVVERSTADTATVRSKGIGVLANGSTGSVTYLDRVVRMPEGWRIAARRILPGPS